MLLRVEFTSFLGGDPSAGLPINLRLRPLPDQPCEATSVFPRSRRLTKSAVHQVPTLNALPRIAHLSRIVGPAVFPFTTHFHMGGVAAAAWWAAIGKPTPWGPSFGEFAVTIENINYLKKYKYLSI